MLYECNPDPTIPPGKERQYVRGANGIFPPQYVVDEKTTALLAAEESFDQRWPLYAAEHLPLRGRHCGQMQMQSFRCAASRNANAVILRCGPSIEPHGAANHQKLTPLSKLASEPCKVSDRERDPRDSDTSQGYDMLVENGGRHGRRGLDVVGVALSRVDEEAGTQLLSSNQNIPCFRDNPARVRHRESWRYPVTHIDGVEVCDVLAGGQSVGAGHGARATGEKLPIQQLVTRKPI
jgi:hypothetical protein